MMDEAHQTIMEDDDDEQQDQLSSRIRQTIDSRQRINSN